MTDLASTMVSTAAEIAIAEDDALYERFNTPTGQFLTTAELGIYIATDGLLNRFCAAPALAEAPLLSARTTALRGPVVFRPTAGATEEEIAQYQAYVAGSNRALNAGYLSPTGRVSTKGVLRTEASVSAAEERAQAAAAGRPYGGNHAGHVPDTTWTGRPDPFEWLSLAPRVNSSLGAQAARYPVGYQPTIFIFEL